MPTDRAEELRRRPDIAQDEMSEATRRLREQAWALGALAPSAPRRPRRRTAPPQRERPVDK